MSYAAGEGSRGVASRVLGRKGPKGRQTRAAQAAQKNKKSEENVRGGHCSPDSRQAGRRSHEKRDDDLNDDAKNVRIGYLRAARR
ncbi:hypothetical protein [Capybara microvirus Cap3_SP_449]|nr:hypothetical protein [Capybara microvirus Cap3_SP_449]